MDLTAEAIPPKPSTRELLQDLGIQLQRRQSHLPLKEDLIHQLPKPMQGAGAAAIAEINKSLGALRLEIGAEGLVRMGHEGRSAGPDSRAGRGQGPAQRAWPDP